jgi:hypothetical protein
VTGRRPWWASDGPVDGGLDAAEDPVEQFRAARRGGRTHVPPGDTDAGDVPFGDVPCGDVPFDDAPGGGDHGAGADPGDHASTDGTGPWWEAAAETVSRLARDLADTAEAHRDDGATADPDATPWDAATADGAAGPGGGQPTDAADDTTTAAGGAGDGDHRIDACGVCPICVGLRTLGESRPELVGHLAEAARHVALAARSLGARSPSSGSGQEPLQRIDLDD